MLLQRLSDYAGRLRDLSPTAYEPTPIRYYIELDVNGRLASTSRNYSPTRPVHRTDFWGSDSLW